VFGEVTTGASNDLEQATNIAKTMITRYGMSEKLGPRTFGKREEMVFLGKEISEQRDYSEGVAEKIDAEVFDLLDSAYQTAVRLITTHRGKLDAFAEFIIEHETVEGDVLHNLLSTGLPTSDSDPDSVTGSVDASPSPSSGPDDSSSGQDDPPSEEPESPPAASPASA